MIKTIIACWKEVKAALRCLKDVFLWFSQGAGSRLESVGEDDELMVENGESTYEIAVKYSRGGRKHSLPQQLESAGARQVGAKTGLALSISLCLVLLDLSGAHRHESSETRPCRYMTGTETRPAPQNEMRWPPIQNFFTLRIVKGALHAVAGRSQD